MPAKNCAIIAGGKLRVLACAFGAHHLLALALEAIAIALENDHLGVVDEAIDHCGLSPGTGKSHLSIALGVQAARRGHRVAFATAHEWVLRLGEPSGPAASTRSSSASGGSLL